MFIEINAIAITVMYDPFMRSSTSGGTFTCSLESGDQLRWSEVEAMMT